MEESHEEMVAMMLDYIAREKTTQKHLAELVGVTEATMSKWISGKATSLTAGSRARIRSICQAPQATDEYKAPMPEVYKRKVLDAVMASSGLSNDAKASVYAIVIGL